MMVVVMKPSARVKEVAGVIKHVEELGLSAHVNESPDKTLVGVVGDIRTLSEDHLRTMSGVENVIPIQKPYKLASREFKPQNTVVKLNGTRIGGDAIAVMAGPCAVESYDQVYEAAVSAKESGAKVLRGGAFKPRTSPYSFQGLGEQGLEILSSIGKKVGLPVVTECLSQDHVELVSHYADIIQVGARNMQNYAILEKLGGQPKPILLKRGMNSTIEELLMSAEYILSNGNANVMLCERGIRTFERATRNTCDISAVPVLKHLSHLPVIVDPSHATGERHLVGPVALAAIAAGADGIIVEIHPYPETARCDGHQSLFLSQFAEMMTQLTAVAEAVGRTA